MIDYAGYSLGALTQEQWEERYKINNVPPVYHTKHNGIYYKYNTATDFWELSDSEFDIGNKWCFVASKYRIDQAIEKVLYLLTTPEYTYGK